jgi:hypothetical protein
MDDNLDDLVDLEENDSNSDPESESELESESESELIELEDYVMEEKLKYIVVTCKALTNSYLNLQLVAKKLLLNENIVGKKLLNYITEGEIKTKTEKKKRDKHAKIKKRADFSNQLTLVINYYKDVNIINGTDNFYNELLIEAINNRKEKNKLKNLNEDLVQLNMKVFGNGKIMITGGLTTMECKYGVKLLQENILNLTDEIQINPLLTINDLFGTINKYNKYLKKYYLHILKLFIIYNVSIDLNFDIILNDKILQKYEVKPTVFTNITNYSIDECNTILFTNLNDINVDTELVKFSKIIQILDILIQYYSSAILLEKLIKNDEFVYSIMNKLYNCEKLIFPSTFTKDKFIEDPIVSIANYNTIYNINYNIDRSLITNIINNKYVGTEIFPARYDPSEYQGVKVKYISRVCCNVINCKSHGYKKSKCECKQVSFLIFQNKTIITGVKEWKQIIDGYTKLKEIFTNEYDKIKILVDYNTAKSSTPSKLIYNNETYISKEFILNNPRNYYILKNNNLLNYYKL